jgi:RecA/RadA recombinase
MSLADRLLKATALDHSALLSVSKVYNEKTMVATKIPIINIALSSTAFGGVCSGITTFAGPSKHFKSLFCLICAKAYLDEFKDAILVFYDCEFGTPPAYFKSLGIDTSRVIHVPIMNYEELSFDMNKKLDEITRGDRVIFIIDSLGNLASKKEAEDAKNEKSAQDMTRAKVNKSLFRVITPHFRLKDIPLFVVQHTYDTLELYSKKVVSGGQGTMLSSDNVFIIGRQQEKENASDKEISGYNFTLTVEKSRFVKEKSKFDVTVNFTGGIRRWSGLLDIALEGGYVTKVSAQKYAVVDKATGEVQNKDYKIKDIENNSEVFMHLFTNTDFNEFIISKFAISHGDLIEDDEDVSSYLEDA